MTTINTPIQHYDDMAELWALPEALMGGTRAMRQAAQIYLPKEGAYAENANGTVDTTKWVGESDQAYQRRLNRTVLLNAFKKAVFGLRGKVFSNPITLPDETPERIVHWLDDVDLQGNDLTAFAYDVFGVALTYGISYLLIDSTRLPDNATSADARRAKARPYLIHVHPRNVIGWRYDDGGLEQVRIREYTTSPKDEYNVQNLERVRVMRRTHWELWEAQASEDSGPLSAGRLLVNRNSVLDQKSNFIQIDEGANPLNEIPLVPVYTGRIAPMQAEPPLMDLAYKNLEHWQSSSDQRHILHVARVPLLFGRGFDGASGQVEIGANRLISSTSDKADLKFVEHSGASVEAGREDLERLELQMKWLSLEPMMPNSGDMTATAKAIDKAEADSQLQAWALNLQDALEQAIWMMDRLAGFNDGATVNINADYGLTLEHTEDIKALMQLWTQDGLSLETLWDEMKRRGTLDEDFDAEAEQEKIDAQEPRLPVVAEFPPDEPDEESDDPLPDAA